MSMAEALANIALGVSNALGVGFHDAVAHWPGTATEDLGGSIETPGTPVEKTCSAQVDFGSEQMRADLGFTDRQALILVLAATLDGDLDTDARLEVLAGPHAGWWTLQTAKLDGAGIYWECRGTKQ